MVIMTQLETRQPLAILADRNYYEDLSDFLTTIFAAQPPTIERINTDNGIMLPNADKIIIAAGVASRDDFPRKLHKILNAWKSTNRELLIFSNPKYSAEETIKEWLKEHPDISNEHIKKISVTDKFADISKAYKESITPSSNIGDTAQTNILPLQNTGRPF